MKKLEAIFVLVLLVVVMSTSGQSPSGNHGFRPPNVVFFLVDDLGWSDVGCFGSQFYETPAIDQFAQTGVRFTNAYAACHVCSPTRSSILTGKYPARNGMTDWIWGRRDFPFQRLLNVKTRQALPFEELTLAEKLRGHGYRTAAIGKWHLGKAPSTPDRHGFDEHLPKNWNGGAPNRTFHAPYGLEGLEEAPEGEYLTDRLTDEAIDFIKRHSNEPFFLYFAHFAVHDPIQGRKDLVAKYEQKLKAEPVEGRRPFILEGNPDEANPLSRGDLDRAIHDSNYEGFKVLPNRTVKIKQYQDNVQFAGMVEAVDESFGRLMATLDDLGLTEETIVIFFADNGGMSGANLGNPKRVISEDKLDAAFSTSNLPLRGAKGWLYEGGIRVPCIIRWPEKGLKEAVSDEPIISTDFYPSILDMTGMPLAPHQHLDGTSLVPLLTGGETLDRESIYWHFPHYSNHGMQSPCGAIRSGDYKLIEYFENQTVQLFNLKEDLGEQHDLSQTHPGIVNRLRTRLHQWREDVGAKSMKPNPTYQP